jgi:hypothetical protein
MLFLKPLSTWVLRDLYKLQPGLPLHEFTKTWFIYFCNFQLTDLYSIFILCLVWVQGIELKWVKGLGIFYCKKFCLNGLQKKSHQWELQQWGPECSHPVTLAVTNVCHAVPVRRHLKIHRWDCVFRETNGGSECCWELKLWWHKAVKCGENPSVPCILVAAAGKMNSSRHVFSSRNTLI